MIAPNTTPIQSPKSGPGESTPTITKAGTSDNFSADSTSADNRVREIDRLAKVWTRKTPMNAAPISPVLLMTDANQFDVRVDPNPIPRPHVDASAFQAVVFQLDLS